MPVFRVGLEGYSFHFVFSVILINLFMFMLLRFLCQYTVLFKKTCMLYSLTFIKWLVIFVWIIHRLLMFKSHVSLIKSHVSLIKSLIQDLINLFNGGGGLLSVGRLTRLAPIVTY